MDLFMAISQGVGTSLATGLRSFLPPLLVCAMARGNLAVDFEGSDYEFLESTLNQYTNLAMRVWNFCLQEQLAGAIYGSAAADADGVAQIVTRLSELQKAALEADIALQTKVAALLTEAQRQQVIAQASLRPGAPGAGPRSR